jgi:hypothetical protein
LDVFRSKPCKRRQRGGARDSDFDAIEKMTAEITRIQTAAMANAMSAATQKEDMTVNVQLNSNKSVGYRSPFTPILWRLSQRGAIEEVELRTAH